jgi:hypothetical protein
VAQLGSLRLRGGPGDRFPPATTSAGSPRGGPAPRPWR